MSITEKKNRLKTQWLKFTSCQSKTEHINSTVSRRKEVIKRQNQ